MRGSSHSLKIMVGRMCTCRNRRLNSCQRNNSTQAENSETRRLLETSCTTGFNKIHNLCRDHYEITATLLNVCALVFGCATVRATCCRSCHRSPFSRGNWWSTHYFVERTPCSCMTCHCHSSIQNECIGGAGVGDLHFFVADVTKLFDALRRKIFDCALGRLGLPSCFRKV